jgi:sporulation protein YlmC with PRC-barrel domain
MNAKIIAVVGALILSVVFFGSTSFAKDVGYYPMGPISEATSLMGKPVTGQAGEYLGQISDFIIDEANNRVSLVVLSAVPGFGSHKVSVPYGCLQRSGDQTFSIRFSNVMAPAVGSGQDPDLSVLRQYPADSPLYSIPEPVAPNWVAEVYRTYGYLPYWVQKGERTPYAGDFSETTKLVGTKVAATGEKVDAMVNDMTIDSSGRLDLLILSHVPGRGAHKVAVPFDALRNSSDGALVLNIAGDRLEMAPVFHRSDTNRPGYDKRVDRFFGLSPRWTVKHQAESDPYRWGGESQGS